MIGSINFQEKKRKQMYHMIEAPSLLYKWHHCHRSGPPLIQAPWLLNKHCHSLGNIPCHRSAISVTQVTLPSYKWTMLSKFNGFCTSITSVNKMPLVIEETSVSENYQHQQTSGTRYASAWLMSKRHHHQ